MKNSTIVILLIVIIIFIVLWLWNDRSFFSHQSSCCTGKNAGCMCRNPKYFKYVGMQKERASEVKDLVGLLVDARCYALTRDNYTNDHSFPPNKEKEAKGCATMCAKSGVPVALLLGDLPPRPHSKAIILLHPAPNLSDYMEKQVRVSGYYMNDMNAIFTTCVEIKKDGEWEDICFATPMIKFAQTKAETFSAPSFEEDIKPLFRQFDVESMKPLGLDLHSYEDVKELSSKILSKVSKKEMPCDKPWSDDKISLFRAWVESGMHK